MIICTNYYYIKRKCYGCIGRESVGCMKVVATQWKAICCTCKSRIRRLHDDAGNWHKGSMENLADQYFKNLFTSDVALDASNVVHLFQEHVLEILMMHYARVSWMRT